MKKHELLEMAIKLRDENCSLEHISEKLNISKSTASLWLRNTAKKKRQLSEESNARILEALARGRKNGLENKKNLPLKSLASQTTIRNRVFDFRGKKCEQCGWQEINQFYNAIPVELHHKDGNKKNNDENNLIVLCPNCHSLTQFYGFYGRSRKL